MEYPSVIIVSPTAKGNALGRAISLARLAELSGIRWCIAAPKDGPVWRGSGEFRNRINLFGDDRELSADVSECASNAIVWAVKPLATSWSAAVALRARFRFPIVLDVDDDDAALAQEFRAVSIVNRLKVNRARMMHPASIRCVRDQAIRSLEGLTYASEAVLGALPPIDSDVPRMWIPHPRSAAEMPPPFPEDGACNIAFLGTVRRHKGFDSLTRLAAGHPNVKLHVFAGQANESSLRGIRDQVMVHRPDEPLSRIFASVDVTVLPQAQLRGADVQLPAKLLDSMQFGRPVVATASSAIREAAGDTSVYVGDWSDDAEVWAQLVFAYRERRRLGLAARHRFEQTLSADSRTASFRQFLSHLVTG